MPTQYDTFAASPWSYLYPPASCIGRDEATGRMWIAYHSTNQRELYVRQSTDGGATWGTPVQLFSNVAGHLIYTVQVLVTPGNRVHVLAGTAAPDKLGFEHAWKTCSSDGSWSTYTRNVHAPSGETEVGIFGRHFGVESASVDNLWSVHDASHNRGWGGNTWADASATWGTWDLWVTPLSGDYYYPQFVVRPYDGKRLYVVSKSGGSQIMFSRQTGTINQWTTMADVLAVGKGAHGFVWLMVGPDDLPWLWWTNTTTKKVWCSKLDNSNVWTDYEVLTTTGAVTGVPTCTRLANGEALLAWGDGDEVWLRRLDASLVAQGEDKRITVLGTHGKVNHGTLRWQQFQQDLKDRIDYYGLVSTDGGTTWSGFLAQAAFADLWPSGGGGGAFARDYPNLDVARVYPALGAARTYPL